jgi:CRP-like cAMP-binding protein
MDNEIAQKVQQHFSTYPKRTYPKGQILVFADEDPEHIFYVVHGKVRQYDVSYRGDEVILTVFGDHAFFPMSWAINHGPNHYFYKTEEETEVHIIPPDDALQYIKNNPDVLLDLISRLYRGMDGLLGRVAHLMAGSARSRLIYELIVESRRFGQDKGNGTFKLQTSEVDLAARAGLSRETVSREIQKLKDRGWLTLNSKSITVEDISELEQTLGQEV